MSNKGGQSLHQHGRAHISTHEAAFLINGSVIPAKTLGQSGLIGIQNLGDESGTIQDGGHIGNLAEGDHVLGQVLGSDGQATDQNTTVDLGALDTTVTLSGQTLTSAECTKTKLSGLGGVFVIENGVVTMADGDTTGEEGGFELQEIKDGGGIALGGSDADIGAQTNILNVQDIARASIQGVTSYLVPQDAINMTVKALQGNVVNMSGLSARGQHQRIIMSDNGGKERSILPETYKACLEDIEKGSQLNFDRELLGDSSEEFQSMEFQSLSDKSNMLMTPQELELMPERGREFEESVGPKEDRPVTPLDSFILNNKLDLNSISIVDGNIVSTSQTNGAPIRLAKSSNTNPMIPVSVPNLQNIISYATSSQSAMTNPPVLDQTPGGLVVRESAPQTTGANQEGASGIATISIATDNSSNSTQILINTPQGQQIFQINTADLNKATTALQPLALQGGLVDRDTSGKVVSAGTVDGITVEDGYLVIPVNGNELDGSLLDADMSLTEGEMSDDSMDGNSPPAVPGRLWMCSQDGCAKTFTKLSKLKIHLMRHTGERPFKCSMSDCDWAFTTAYKLKRHEESHAKKKDFDCDFSGCGRKFTTIYNLNTHRKLHDRPCTEECPDCGLKFPTMRKLDLHMKNHIGAQKNYKCPIEGCNKMFFSPHCMGSHTRVHQEDRDLTCHFEGCGKVYDKLCRLKQHMRTHTGEKPYVCNVESCGWAFSTASKLKRHQRKHTGERKWVCPVEDCNKAFMRAEHLKGHLVTHSGERPFICQVEGCGARFTAKSSMYVHIKKHNEADKRVMYFCPIEACDKRFNNKTGLRGHIAKHYQNALAQANAGDLSSLIPILSPEDIQEGLEGLVAAHGDLAAEAAEDAIVASVNSILPPDAHDTADQNDHLIVAEDGTLTTTSAVHELCGQAVVPASMVAQLIAVSGANLRAIPVTSTAITSLATTTIDAASILLDPNDARLKLVEDQPNVSEASSVLFTQDLNATSILQPEKSSTSSSGSARTDYCSNHMLVDRAKKRRKLLKSSLDCGDSNSSSIDLNSFQDLSEEKSSLGEDSLVPTSSSDPFPGSDLITSTAITFRDPETGAIYVQTQLLQDDPPNPDLYSNDASLEGSGQSVLATDLPSALFQDANGDDDVEFTGTTINLQDLA